MKRLVAAVLVLLLLSVLLQLRPLTPGDLGSRPHPAQTYADALALLDSLRAEDSAAIAPECRSQWRTHGGRTPRVVVFFHGLTNCPAQFDSLGAIAFAHGANVLIPRLPRHGLANRMTDALAGADAAELRAFTDRVLDAAHGLGDSVTVAGLSVGGVLAAWAAQERHDVDRAVAIAPLFGVARARGVLTPAVARLMLAMPNQFVWWDDQRREQLLGPKHVYPRFGTRAIGACMLLGAATRERAAASAPACRSLAVITVGGDMAIDNGLVAATVRAWRAHGARAIETYEFPAELHLSHDVVDPEQAGGNPAVTYPVLVRLIGL